MHLIENEWDSDNIHIQQTYHYNHRRIALYKKGEQTPYPPSPAVIIDSFHQKQYIRTTRVISIDMTFRESTPYKDYRDTITSLIIARCTNSPR